MTVPNLVTDNFTGNQIEPDEWHSFSYLEESDGYSDSSFAGCQYRLPSNCAMDYKIAVNIKVTGRKSHNIYNDRFRTRVQIEFVGDGTPSTFTHGWMYTTGYLIEPVEVTWANL